MTLCFASIYPRKKKKPLTIVCVALFVTVCLSGCDSPRVKTDPMNLVGSWSGITSPSGTMVYIEFESNHNYNYSRVGFIFHGVWSTDSNRNLVMTDISPVTGSNTFTWKFSNNANTLVLKNVNYDDKMTLIRK